jgi:hypothetical protein
MEKNRILELAIETLERQKSEIDAEIESLRSQMGGFKKTSPSKRVTSAVKVTKKGVKSAAERKAHSQKMKKVWAARKAKKAKAAKAKPVKAKAGAKVRLKTEAEKKALSLKMKEVWKKRKAEAAAKNAQSGSA